MSVDAAGMAQTADAAPSPASTPGELLRTGREERGLSVQQVADELHLDVRLVQAIEANDFLALGAPVYARGHLRKYASVVGLPPDLVIAQYETLTDVPAVPTVIPASVADPPPQRVSLRIPALVVGGLVAAGLALWIATWLLNSFDSSTAPTESGSPASTVAPHVEAHVPVQAPTVESVAPEDEAPAAAVNEPLAEAPSSGSGVSVRLDFSEASWVEIYDADERRLMYGIGQPGQTRIVTGTPPLRVTLGVASAVTLNVNDKPVVVPRHANRDATRFSVAADGSLR